MCRDLQGLKSQKLLHERMAFHPSVESAKLLPRVEKTVLLLLIEHPFLTSSSVALIAL